MAIRKQNARYALSLIEDGSVVGLGGGQTIRLLASLLSEKEDISIVTPSSETALICQSAGLKVLPTWLVSSIDIAFDSCDEIDENFIALKSGGGIHTQEKIIGSMAKRYVLLVDLNKYQPRLTYQHPVVLEIVKSSYALVCSQLEKMGLSYHYRKAQYPCCRVIRQPSFPGHGRNPAHLQTPHPEKGLPPGKNNRGGPFAESAPELSFLIVGNQNYPQREVPHEVQMRHPSW